MANVNFKKLDSLLDSGEFWRLPPSDRSVQTPRTILLWLDELEYNQEIEARDLANWVGLAENTCRQYLRWLAAKGMVWTENRTQGRVLFVKAVKSPW